MTSPSSPSTHHDQSTREALLDAAERLFAEHGIAGASLRAITHEASANLASVNYHFGSKEELVKAVFTRRIEPVNGRRLHLLEEVLDAAGDQPPPVAGIVRAFVEPTIMTVGSEPWGPQFGRMVIRATAEPGEQMRDLVLAQFRDVKERFVDAFARALPELSLEEVYWRFHFTVATMVHTAGLGSMVCIYSGGVCTLHDPEALAERVVAFVTAGWRAPALPTETSS